MTLDQVLALDNRALNMAVAARIGWQSLGEGAWRRPDGTMTNEWHIPDFAEDYPTVVQVETWADQQPHETQQVLTAQIIRAARARLGHPIPWAAMLLLWVKPIDYARAVCLTVEVPGA